MLVTLELGEKIDTLNQRELREALAEDARLRATVTGVKTVDQFFNAGATGSVNAFSTPVNMIAGGLVWAVMNIGLELSAAAAVRVYKQVVTATTPIGNGRLVAQTSSVITPSFQFSKGQLMMRAGDQITLLAQGGPNVLSVFLTATEIAAERVGELLL